MPDVQEYDAPPELDPEDIKILGIPYGGPNNGRDNSGQWFSPMSELYDGVIPRPGVFYTHGTENGFDPELVGDVTASWDDRDGRWFAFKLDPMSSRYTQLMEAYRTNNMRASTGVVPASYDYNPLSGHIDSWLAGDLSLVDLREGYQPVNGYAVTKAEVVFTDPENRPVFVELLNNLADMMDGELSTALRSTATMYPSEDEQDQYAIQLLNEALLLLKGEEMTPETETAVRDLVAQATNYIKAQETFGGKKRSDLKDSDFIFPDSRSFPVVTCADVSDAVSSWGRYKGSETFETFKSRLTARAKALGCQSSLPEAWNTTKAESMPDEKCESCEEAARLAAEVKAEIQAESTKCQRCPEAIKWVRAMFKAAKVTATEAFDFIERFTKSDDDFDTVQATIEARTVVPAGAKAFVAAGTKSQDTDKESYVDEDWMAKQRRQAGLPVAKVGK